MLLKFLPLLFVVACLDARIFSKTDFVAKSILSSYELLKQEWDHFKETYNKKFKSDEEDLERMAIFADNKLLIAHHNDLYEKGVVTYTLKINKFGDMTVDELNNNYGLNKETDKDDDVSHDEATYIPPSIRQIPKERDWRKDGAVTEVKDQQECKCCWAFSATGALEGQYYRKNHRLVEMSEQNLIDCSTEFGNFGCSGGWPRKAITYTKINEGIDTEKSYPYKAHSGICRYNSTYAVTGAKGYHRIPNDEKKLQDAVGVSGPVSVLVNANGAGFWFYDGGVHFNSTCSKKLEDLNHAVLVVGYGTADLGQEYWIVKNSWGAKWGEDGYIRMARNQDNNCGIVTEAIIPVV